MGTFNHAVFLPPNSRKGIGGREKVKVSTFSLFSFSFSNGKKGERGDVLADIQARKRKIGDPAQKSKEKGIQR